MFAKFVDERMKATEEKIIDIFTSIPKSKIESGLQKAKAINNTLNVIKEDRQTFGLLVAKSEFPNEAFKYPLTAVLLALAEPDQILRQQSSKSTLSRCHNEKLDSVVKETPDKADWSVDRMEAVSVVSPQETCKDFADAILSYCKPKDVTCPKRVTFIIDSYNSTSIKQSTRIKRGQPGRRDAKNANTR